MSNHAIVVWEYENRCAKWKPYSPVVCQCLERAYAKKLTRALLSDADPNFAKSYVNFRLWLQISDESDTMYRVRRQFYPQTSPAGKGVQWEWSGQISTEWHVFTMDIQCVLEEFWSKGCELIDLTKTNLNLPYVINFNEYTQTKLVNGSIKNIRRVQQASYPMIKIKPEELQQIVGRKQSRKTSKSNSCIPIAKMIQNDSQIVIKKKTSPKKHESTNTITRTLLNIFNVKNSNNSHGNFETESTSTKSSSYRGRRQSIDTVSTYLSHDSEHKYIY